MVLPVVRTCKIVYWWLFWSSCFCGGNGRWLVVEGWSNGGRTPRVSVIDHPRNLHTHSALCGCCGRVVEILQLRACACVHTCTYYVIYKRVASIFLPARVGYFLEASFISFMRLRKAFSALPALGMPRERACLKVRSACL